MELNWMKTGLICLLLLNFLATDGQNIVVDKNLQDNSEPMKVKMGTQGFGKIVKWQFGEFAVVESKAGWTKTTSKGNLFNTKTESKTTQKFSFTLCNENRDSARINAAKNLEVKEVQGFELFPGFSIGENNVQLDSRNFTAAISINSDTLDTWVLLFLSERGSQNEYKASAILSNGQRKIMILPASSNKNGTDKRKLPALGYEFSEDGKVVSALQYYGGGALGMNKNIVWIDNTLEPRLKLILASATTAVLQFKTEEFISVDQ